jgi:hypothetical protein
VAGTSLRTKLHSSSGALAGQAATVAGTSARTRIHSASGALTGANAIVVGSATKTRIHVADGAIYAGGATMNGVAIRSVAGGTPEDIAAMLAQIADLQAELMMRPTMGERWAMM